MMATAPEDFTVVLVAPDDDRARQVEDHLVELRTQVRRCHSIRVLDGLVHDLRPQLVLLDLTALDPGVEAVEVVADLVEAAPVVVVGDHEEPLLRLDLIAEGAQDYVARDVLYTDHVLWTVLGSYGRWLFERSLALRHDERAGLERRLELARDLHDETIQRLFVCRLQLDPDSDEMAAIDRELSDIIAHLRSTIRQLLGTGETLLDEVTSLCEHHRRNGQQVVLGLAGDLTGVADHVRLQLLDAVVTLLTLATTGDTEIELDIEANEHHVELQARFFVDRPQPTVEAGLDLGRLTHSATRLGGVMGWTWTEGLARVRWTVPADGRLRQLS